jgi:RNA polymerase sigma factor (TIGR02999 family)
MSTPSQHEITRLLLDWRDGDREALDQLVPIVHQELRRLARHYMRGERTGHTLQTSALINEAYLRLVDHTRIDWQNRAHFFGVAAQAMRRVLVDHARARGYQKRGAGAHAVELEEVALLAEERASELVALDEALAGLARFDPRKAQVVELRYFGGLTGEEIAEVLGLSPATVQREWQSAKLWLLQALSDTNSGYGDARPREM